MGILVIGSIAFDSVETPFGKRNEVLGGSATFFSLSARFFDTVSIVACVGEDFPGRMLAMLRSKGIGIDGVEVLKGRTFRWKARYGADMNIARTLATHLNVFSEFVPKIPAHLAGARTLFLANIDPSLQDDVLRQVRRPRLVACDTMNFWITHKRKALRRLIRKVDIILLNDSEAKQLSGEENLLKAAKAIRRMGPEIIVIKKGEHGVLLSTRGSHLLAPAYLLESIRDPTGAGDSFAGGMLGYLGRHRRIDEQAVRRSVIYGTIVASFAVEDFSVRRLLTLRKSDIVNRYRDFCRITRF